MIQKHISYIHISSILLEGAALHLGQVDLRPNAHRNQLLEEQLAGVGHADLVHSLALAVLADF